MQCASPVGGATPDRLHPAGPSRWPTTRPTMSQIETDVWVDKSAALQRRRTLHRDDRRHRCIDGPGDQGHRRPRGDAGLLVLREHPDLHRRQHRLDECAPLVAQGCTPGASTCTQTQRRRRACARSPQDSYSCPVGRADRHHRLRTARPTSSAWTANCFNISCTERRRLRAQSMSMLEAGREAGVYLDTNRMQVFKGEENRCRDQPAEELLLLRRRRRAA
ncbi:MAG: conjugal transfer protein TraN [Comamonadaceae bacterium]|nr:conjugal transfer protein TraN [Comamonadaceae bacterium]